MNKCQCECEVCGRKAHSEEYPYCDEHIAVGMGYEKEIGELNSLPALVSFVEKLQEEFPPTNFAAVLPLLQPSFYGYSVKLRYSDEGSYGAKSGLRVQISGGASWGAQTPAEFYCDYSIVWDTSSGHLVRIEGELNDKYTGEGSFRVYRGTDKSGTFYPLVKKILLPFTNQ